MVFNSHAARAGAALPLIGIVLAIANWRARPRGAAAWAAVIVMFLIMVVVRSLFQLAFWRSSNDATSARSFDAVNSGVVWGALIMVIPLAVMLGHTYGLVADQNSGTRITMIIMGAYLVVLGNTMPRQLPPASSMQDGGARIQAFQRRAGWTWVLCGLGFMTAWLALPTDAAGPVSTAIVVAALIVTGVDIFRIRKVRIRKPTPHAPGLNS
jgi:hypothetical protein